jgi:hypothetical protein
LQVFGAAVGKKLRKAAELIQRDRSNMVENMVSPITHSVSLCQLWLEVIHVLEFCPQGSLSRLHLQSIGKGYKFLVITSSSRFVPSGHLVHLCACSLPVFKT